RAGRGTAERPGSLREPSLEGELGDLLPAGGGFAFLLAGGEGFLAAGLADGAHRLGLGVGGRAEERRGPGGVEPDPPGRHEAQARALKGEVLPRRARAERVRAVGLAVVEERAGAHDDEDAGGPAPGLVALREDADELGEARALARAVDEAPGLAVVGGWRPA